MANVTPLGYPHYGVGTVEILLKDIDGADFSILFAPDPKNNELRNAGLPIQFYYYPKNPRLAKHPDGRFKFSMQVFSGVATEGSVIGVEGLEEEAGGFTTLTTTLDIPEDLLKKSIDKLKEKLQAQFGSKRSGLFGLFSFIIGKDKDFNHTNVRPVQLTENNILMHVVGKDSEGKDVEAAAPWAMKIQGAGAGSTFGLGENAFSVLMGRYNTSIVKSALENGTNNLTVENHIKYKAYIPTTTIKTTVNAEKVHSYFSSKVGVKHVFVDINWEHEYEKIRTSGGIKSEIITDEQFSSEERKKVEEALLSKQREFAFEMLKKQIFDPADKVFTPAKDPSISDPVSSIFRIFTGGVSFGVSLKSGKQIRELDVSDEITFSAISLFDSKVAGNLDPLTTKTGDAAKKELEQYITEVPLDEDFKKVQIITALDGGLIKLDKDNDIVNDSPVSQVSIEVGYPDSKGKIVWKGSGRMIAPEGNPYVRRTAKNGKEIDAIFPAIWNSNLIERNLFVFDFAERLKESKIKVRQTVMYEKDKRIKLKNKTNEFEFTGTKVFIPLPVQGMLNYELSTEELFDCDTLEVTFKADKMSSKKFKFTVDNFEDIIPYRAWYEADYQIKPTEYKVKYTCKGKVGKKSKKVTVSTDYIKLDYLEGNVLFEIPSGTEAQNKDVEAIRKAFLEE